MEKHNNEKTNNNKTFHTLLKIEQVSTQLVLQKFLLIEKKVNRQLLFGVNTLEEVL